MAENSVTIMRRVILESPFGAPDWLKIIDNIYYARKCVKDSIHRGEAPLASHLLYTQVGILDDTNSAERNLGMAARWSWIGVAEAMVVYTDKGISPGMQGGIAIAEKLGIPIEYRKL